VYVPVVNRSWVVLVLAGLLVGASVVLGLVALAGRRLAAPLALLAGVAGYRLWRTASDSIVESVYDDVGGNPLDEDARDDDERPPEDWHHGGGIGGSVTDGGAATDWAEAEADPEEWPWDGPFWREPGDGTDARDEAGAADGDGTDRNRSWTGRGRETGPEDPGDGTGHGAGDAGRGGRRGSRTTGGAGGAGGSDRSDGADRWWERDDWGPSSHARRDPAVAEAYDVLGLQPGDDATAIRRAYRERVKEAHPDTPGGSAEEFRRVRAAYELLDDRVEDADADADGERERGVG